MFHVVDKLVYAMASLRFFSGSMELLGGFAMLYFGTQARALQVNSLLALVGPFVLVAVNAIGVAGMAGGEVRVGRIFAIVLGVGLILYGSRS